MSKKSRVRDFVVHLVIGAALGLLFLGGVSAVRADPTPPHPRVPTPGTRAPNPFAPPTGKDGFFIFSPGQLPGAGLPWLRNWVTDPHEEDVPEEPGDIGGGGIGGPG